MNLYISEFNGFCSGVERAYDMAIKTASNKEKVYCLGELVHNKNVTKQLEEQGIKVIENIENLNEGDTLIIRAHGATQSTYIEAEGKGVKVVDATCPMIIKMRKVISKFYSEGYQIVIVGDKLHPEIVGLNGWCNDTAIITDGTGILDVNRYDKVLILHQTTYNYENYVKSLKNIKKECVKMLEVFDSICYTTKGRQNYITKIISKCEYIVVVGDKKSANTNRLYQLALSKNVSAEFVEDSHLLSKEFLKYDNVAIVCGASTPKTICNQVAMRALSIAKDSNKQVTVIKEKILNQEEQKSDDRSN